MCLDLLSSYLPYTICDAKQRKKCHIYLFIRTSLSAYSPDGDFNDLYLYLYYVHKGLLFKCVCKLNKVHYCVFE